MKILTWNVNSIRVRLERLLGVLDRHAPDVVCLQETKVDDGEFPRAALERAGWHVEVSGQRTYNGVALLSRSEPEDVERGFGDAALDGEHRLIAATVDGVRIVDVYVPNGSHPESPKFAFKLAWLERLASWLDATADPSRPLALCGDFNVAPEDRDVHAPERWRGKVLFHPEEHVRLRRLLDWGLRDTLRLHREEGGLYSWWDYRAGAFGRGWGLRIDLVLVTAPLAARCAETIIDREQRKVGTGPGKPSDHAPVVASFRDA